MCIHVWVISPSCPLPHLLTPSPSTLFSPLPPFQAETVLPLSLILLKKRIKHNKKGKEFFLVELMVVTQKYS
jgi:hypothetical protein